MTAPTIHPDTSPRHERDDHSVDSSPFAEHPFGEQPALLRLRDSAASHDRTMLSRMQLIAETVVEECLDLTPGPDCTSCAGTGCAECSRDRFGLPADRPLAHWVLERMTGEHLTCLAAVLDSTITRAYSAARDALIATFSLRGCHERAAAGGMRFDRLQYVARRAHRLGDAKLAALDALVLDLRPDLSWEAYCRSVNDLIRLLTDEGEQDADVRKNRRVDFWRSDVREGKLLLTGPLEPLHALHRRLESTARQIRRAHAGTFGEQLPAGTQIEDDRTIPQLMFDLLASTAPSTEVEVLVPITESSSGVPGGAGWETADRPAVSGPPVGTENAPQDGRDGAPQHGGVDVPPDGRDGVRRNGADGVSPASDDDASPVGASNCSPDGTDSAPRDEEECDRPAGDDGSADAQFVHTDEGPARRSRVVLTCPSDQEWLRRQATVVVTVPFLTLTGQADLPGHWSDGSPIPADMARRFASTAEKFYRVLTDPVSGEVCDEIARTYTVPWGMRVTMNETWAWCTAPGCARRAETCEADHLRPFDRARPARGGHTDLDNLHPLCPQHHQMKTEGTLRLIRTADGFVCWQFSHGITHTTTPADRPIDREAARITRRLLGLDEPDDDPPGHPEAGPPGHPHHDPPNDSDGGPRNRPGDGLPHRPSDSPPRDRDGDYLPGDTRAPAVIDPWECWERSSPPRSDEAEPDDSRMAGGPPDSDTSVGCTPGGTADAGVIGGSVSDGAAVIGVTVSGDDAVVGVPVAGGDGVVGDMVAGVDAVVGDDAALGVAVAGDDEVIGEMVAGDSAVTGEVTSDDSGAGRTVVGVSVNGCSIARTPDTGIQAGGYLITAPSVPGDPVAGSGSGTTEDKPPDLPPDSGAPRWHTAEDPPPF